jgi:hypothetical protein
MPGALFLTDSGFITLGSCSDSPSLGPEDYLFRGLLANFTVFSRPLSRDAIRNLTLNWKLQNSNDSPELSESTLVASSNGKFVSYDKDSRWETFGSPFLVDPQFGDCALSVTLSVAAAKVSQNEDEITNTDNSIYSLGNLKTLTVSDKVLEFLNPCKLFTVVA